MHACMHAWASLSWKPVAPEGKVRKQLIKNYTYVQACMHAGAPLSWKTVAPDRKCGKIIEKLHIYACMHACMLGHPLAGACCI